MAEQSGTQKAGPEPSRREKRQGRRPGTESTRSAVLEAARTRFASRGFTDTTIRAVAADAGVDPSQVMQFYRSKEQLFAAVMALPQSALDRFATAFDGPDDHLGERVVRSFLSAWESVPEESEPLMAMLRGAIVNESAAAALRDFIEARLNDKTRGRTDPEAPLRSALASSMLVGLITGRDILGVPTLAEAEVDELVAITAPAIQEVLAGSSPAQHHPSADDGAN